MVHNARYQEGMTTSIQAGVAAAPADAAGFMVCPGDLPLLSPEEYRLAADFFMECLREQPQVIVQPVYEQQPGHPVFFAAAYRADLLALSCPDGCRPILQANRSAVVPFTFPTDHCLRDVDTPEAYDAMAKHFF
jgi:molybdenum cofactor cytidylyltransferase